MISSLSSDVSVAEKVFRSVFTYYEAVFSDLENIFETVDTTKLLQEYSRLSFKSM